MFFILIGLLLLARDLFDNHEPQYGLAVLTMILILVLAEGWIGRDRGEI